MKTIAANLKANHTQQSIVKYLRVLHNSLFRSKRDNGLNNVDVIIFPNQACLRNNNYERFSIGAQNAYPIKNGAFTGEIGLEVLASLRIEHLIVGHSERRMLLHESDEFIREKCKFFMQSDMKIILCIGEDSREKDVKSILAKQLEGIDMNYPFLTIAYEPIWAIGSGQIPSIDDIAFIAEMLAGFGAKRVLYGGSVNYDNIAEICEITDGVLVGGASLDAMQFAQMIQKVISLFHKQR